MPRAGGAVVELLGGDFLAAVQCVAIDADAFPYPSALFGRRSPSSPIWVACEGGERRVVAFLASRAPLRVLHIDGVAVDRGFRRRGLGRALVREAVAFARSERRVSRVELHVSPGNTAAIALYASVGFAVVRRLGGFYPAAAFDGETDAYKMVLPL